MTYKQWQQENELLCKDMDKWREKYRCAKRCSDWRTHKFCGHLVDARAQYFRKRINKQIFYLINLNEEKVGSKK